MAFDEAELQTLHRLLKASDGGASVVADYRAQFPGRSITRCDESDMSAEPPFRSFNGFDLHLVDGRDHCWHITREPQSATGIVLARHRERA